MKGQVALGHPMMFAPVPWDFSRAPPRRGKSVEELVSDGWERERYIQMMHFQQQQQQQQFISPQDFMPAPGHLEHQAYVRQANGMRQPSWEYEDWDRIPHREGLPQQPNQFFYQTPEAVFQEPRRLQEWDASHCFYVPREDMNYADHREDRDHVQSPRTKSANHMDWDRYDYWDEDYEERTRYSRRDRYAYTYERDKRDYYGRERDGYREKDRYDRRDRDYYEHKESDTYDRKQQDYSDPRHRHGYQERDHYERRGELHDYREGDRYDHREKEHYDRVKVDRYNHREGEQSRRKADGHAYREKDIDDRREIDRYERRKGDRLKSREKDVDYSRKLDRENSDSRDPQNDCYEKHRNGNYYDLKSQDPCDSNKGDHFKHQDKVQYDRRGKGPSEHLDEDRTQGRKKDSVDGRRKDLCHPRDADRCDYREKDIRDYRSDDRYDSGVKDCFEYRDGEDDQYDQKSKELYREVRSASIDQKQEGYNSDQSSWKPGREWEEDVYHKQTVRERRSYEDPVTLYHEGSKNRAHTRPGSGRTDLEKQDQARKAHYVGSLDRNSFYRRTAPSLLRKSEFAINRKQKQGKILNKASTDSSTTPKSGAQASPDNSFIAWKISSQGIRSNKKLSNCLCKPAKTMWRSSHGPHLHL